MTDDSALEALVAAAVERFGEVTILVNNAGGGGPKPFDMPMRDFVWAYQLNVLGVSSVPDLRAPHGSGRRRRDSQQMIESYKLNTIAAMRMTAACRPYLLKAANASITNSGSMVGVLPAFDFLVVLGGEGRAQPPDARPRALLREAGADQLRADRYRADARLRRGWPRREGPIRAHASQQPHRPRRFAAGRGERVPVARFAGRIVGERADDSRVRPSARSPAARESGRATSPGRGGRPRTS